MKRRYNRDKSCGYSAHGSECLCDVKPLGVTIGVADAVNDMFMGRQLCDLKDYGVPWTRDTILDYFTDLCKFYDVYAEHKKNPVIIGDFESLVFPDELRHTNNSHSRIRLYIRKVYNEYDRTMSETLRQLGVTADEYRFSLCKTRSTPRPLTMETLDFLESELLKRKVPPLAELSVKAKLSDAVIRNFARELNDRRKKLYGKEEENKAHKMCETLAHTTNMKPMDIVREVYQETGILLCHTTPSQMRRRHKVTV